MVVDVWDDDGDEGRLSDSLVVDGVPLPASLQHMDGAGPHRVVWNASIWATPWAAKFVAALGAMNNIGAVGPKCQQGNTKILTHDFTHRVHMDIFGLEYYPPELSDWWMDDWISLVYGRGRTRQGHDVSVVHHTGKHGQRYTVDQSHKQRLNALVQSGAKRIRAYLQSQGAGPRTLQAFDREPRDLKLGFRKLTDGDGSPASIAE